MTPAEQTPSSVSVETQVALINQRLGEISEVKADVKEIKNFISSLDSHYLTRSEFDAYKKNNWLTHTLTATLTAVFTALVYYFISHGNVK